MARKISPEERKEKAAEKEEEFAEATAIMSRMQGQPRDKIEEELKANDVPQKVINRLLGRADPSDEDDKKQGLKEAIADYYPKFMRLIKTHKKVAVISAVVSLALLLLFLREVANFMLVVVLLLLASFSTYYKRRLGVPLGGFELVTFGTVITGMLYGPVVGGLFGFIGLTASSVLSADISAFTAFSVLL
ncbi:hypothetical protein JXB11_01690, partial [Candidatus Woesearchaeota archaeon]|nr:hypothetical protein [Candidatus Woesearchaeota archaeon]